jgi:hypothetical protein
MLSTVIPSAELTPLRGADPRTFRDSNIAPSARHPPRLRSGSAGSAPSKSGGEGRAELGGRSSVGGARVTLRSLPPGCAAGKNIGMSSFQVAVPGGVEDVRKLVEQLRGVIEPAVSGYAKVLSRPADVEGGEFSQDLLVSSQRGQLEITVERGKGALEAEVSISAGGSRAGLVPVGMALLVGFVADKSPELLPIFRGLRVMLGAVAGLVVGFVIVALLGAIGFFRRGVDTTLEQTVQAAVRRFLAVRSGSDAALDAADADIDTTHGHQPAPSPR